jgi:flavodoxin
MKNTITVATITLTLIFIFSNCLNGQTAKFTSGTSDSVSGSKRNSIVVFYSRTGNTKAVAKQIQQLTGSDIFQVETDKPYPEDYHKTTEVAKKELNNNARPSIKGKIENFNQYDIVYFGFPIWWGTYPMAMATFIDNYKLEGKTIIPFCTYGGGGVDNAFTDLEKATPKATHLNGLVLSGGQAYSSKNEVEQWLKEIKILK